MSFEFLCLSKKMYCLLSYHTIDHSFAEIFLQIFSFLKFWVLEECLKYEWVTKQIGDNIKINCINNLATTVVLHLSNSCILITINQVPIHLTKINAANTNQCQLK